MKIAPASTNHNHDTLLAILQGMKTAEEAKKWHAAGVQLAHGSVGPNEILYIPPGYISACASANNAPVAAIRQHHLAQSPGIVAQLTLSKQHAIRGSPSEAALAVVLQALSAKRLRV